MSQHKDRQANARDIVDLIETLIELRTNCGPALRENHDAIEVTKRRITDYFLMIDPRKGVFVKGPGD